MRKRPLSLFVCALLFLYFPAEYIFRVVFKGWQHTIPDIALGIVLPILLLVGLIRVNRFGWYTLVAVVSLSGIRDLHEFYMSRGASSSALITHLFIYVLSLSYFINPRIRHLYFDPKLRWWKTKPRYETHLPMVMKHGETWYYPILRNISEGGAFIETSFMAPLNEVIDIAIPLPIPLNVSVLTVKGEVRWASNHPSRAGIGVQFVQVPPDQEQAVKAFVQKQL